MVGPSTHIYTVPVFLPNPGQGSVHLGEDRGESGRRAQAFSSGEERIGAGAWT